MAKKIKVLDNVSGVEQIINVSSLASNSTLTGSDLMLIEQSNTLKKVSITDLSAEFGGGGVPTFESRTLSSNITLNKSDGWANYVRINNTSGSLKTITFGTDYSSGNYYFFSFDFETSQIQFSIQSRTFTFWGGGTLFLFYDGTNWNNIFPNQNQYNETSYDRGLNIGFNNRTGTTSIGVGRQVTSRGNVSVGFGEGVDISNGTSALAFGTVITSSGNYNRLFGNNITNSGTNNSILGHFNNGSGSYNNIVVDDSYNPNNKSYLKGLGQGVRFLHNGEIALKIDDNNYSTTATQSHLRIVNFGAITTNATQTEIYLNDSTSADRLVIPAKSSYMIKGRMSAVQSDFSDIKHWEFNCSLLRDGSNNTSLQGTTNITVLQESSGATTWDLILSADNTNDSLKVEVIGQASQTIYWKGIFEIIDLMLP